MANRPKGFADWNPSPEVSLVLHQCKDIFREYRDYLPMTVRQVFYRLVGQYGYEKTERAYKRLGNYLVRARRAQMIPFSYIRDDGVDAFHGMGGATDIRSFWPDVLNMAEGFTLDRGMNQPYDIEVWCEAAGMAPMLARAVQEYGVNVYSTGGFSSVTVTHQIARRVAERERPTKFLQLGDYDPSGQSIFETMDEDVWRFVAGYRIETSQWEAIRVAITPDQIEEHNIPTAPPKASDSRSVNWLDETCQLEAMPPDLITDIIRERVEGLMDLDAWEDVKTQEAQDTETLITQVERAMDELDEQG